MREEIEKILEEFDARYAHLSTASRVVHLYGSHGKLIEDMRNFLKNALVSVVRSTPSKDGMEPVRCENLTKHSSNFLEVAG